MNDQLPDATEILKLALAIFGAKRLRAEPDSIFAETLQLWERAERACVAYRTPAQREADTVRARGIAFDAQEAPTGSSAAPTEMPTITIEQLLEITTALPGRCRIKLRGGLFRALKAFASETGQPAVFNLAKVTDEIDTPIADDFVAWQRARHRKGRKAGGEATQRARAQKKNASATSQSHPAV